MSLKSRVKRMISNLIMFLGGMRKLEKQVLFTSFGGLSYSDNPRAISEALHELDPSVKIVWAFHNPEEKKGIIPSYIETFSNASFIRFFSRLSTSAVWVSNNEFQKANKRKGQVYVQTWHGDRAFKKVLYDSTFVDKTFYLSEAKSGFIDLAVAGSDYGERQYRSAFRYPGEIMNGGTPRDDALIVQDKVRIKQIRTVLNIPDDVMALLYAPTLRRSNKANGRKQQIQDIDIPHTLSMLEKKYDCKWVCLMRAHPGTSVLTGVEYNDRIRDVSSFEDMTDLMLASDLLITDYSSCAGDYALLERPIILYQSDRQEYIEKDRTFYFDMDDSPYFIAESQQDVDAIITKLTEESITENCRAILDFYGTHENGRSAYDVAQWIIDRMREL